MFSEITKNKYIILGSVALLLLEILLAFFVGLEAYKSFVVGIILILGVLVLIDPFYGLLLTLVSSFFIEGELIYEFVLFRFLGFNWYLMELVFVVLYFSFLIRLFSGAYKVDLNPVFVSIYFFLFVCCWGIYWGIKNGNQFQSVFYDLRGFFYYLTFLPAVFVLRDKKKLRNLFYFLILLGTIKSGIDSYRSLFVMERMFDPEIQQYVPFARLKGSNEVVYPITFIGTLVYFLLEKNARVRLFLLPSIFLSATALYLSYTRGSWLAAIVSLVVTLGLFVFSGKYKINYGLAILSLSIIAAVYGLAASFGLIDISIFTNRLTSISLNKIDISNLGRMVEWATALEAFMRNPLFGAGLGFMFTYFAPGIGELSTEYCHNSYLYVLAKMGLIGLVPFLIMLFFSLRTGFLIIKVKRDQQDYDIAYCFILMLFFLAVKSFTTWHLNTVTFSMFVGILLGVSALYLNKMQEDK